MKRFLLVIFLVIGCSTVSQSQNLRGNFVTPHVFTLLSGYNSIGAEKKSNVFFQINYGFNYTVKPNKVILQLPISGYYNVEDATDYPFTLLQPGRLSFLPTLYFLDRNTKSELYAFISTGVKVFKSDKQIRRVDDPKFIEQGLIGLGGGLNVDKLLEVSLEYNFIWNDLTTRTENYFEANELLSQGKQAQSIIGTLKIYPLRRKHKFDFYSFLDLVSFIDTFENERFIRGGIGVSVSFP